MAQSRHPMSTSQSVWTSGCLGYRLYCRRQRTREEYQLVFLFIHWRNQPSNCGVSVEQTTLAPVQIILKPPLIDRSSAGASNASLRAFDVQAHLTQMRLFETLRRIPPTKFCLVGIHVGLDHAEALPACFVVASGGVSSEGYEYDGPGVWLGNAQTKTEVVPCRKVDAATRCYSVSSHT